MKKDFSEIFPSGTVDARVTSLTLVNNTLKTLNVSVPTDELWALQTITMTNPDNVDRVCYARLFKEVAKTNMITQLMSGTVAAASRLCYPNNAIAETHNNQTGEQLLLGPNMTIGFTWAAGGASAGGTDADGLVVFVRKLTLT